MGSSIARTAYAGILPAYQPKLRQSQTLKIQEESQAKATFVQELATEPEFADEEWLSRPADRSFKYCGLDEFDGRYYKCEVKNRDQNCSDFKTRAAGSEPRACSSCRHHRLPLGNPVRVLEETFRRYGQRSIGTLDQEIKPLVQMQAEAEYQDCVDFAGFLPKVPAFLPVCLVRTSPEPMTGEPRYLVGPVVNSAARCSEWSPGASASSDLGSAQLDALVGHVRGIVSQAEAATYRDPLQVGGAMRLQANAECAVIARCLAMLGASPEHIAEVCNTFTQVFGEAWDPQLSAQIDASAPRVAPSQYQQTAPARVARGRGGAPASVSGVQAPRPQMSAEAAYEAGKACMESNDDEAAVAWLRQAAEQGHVPAAYWLGVEIWSDDLDEAMRWWRWAAEHGDMDAVDTLTAHLREGPARDLTEALRWLRVMATDPNPRRSERARREIAEVEAELQGTAQDDEGGGEELLTPEQVAKLNRITDLRTPLNEVFTESEIAMITQIPNPDLRRQQEMDMRAYKARALRQTLENLASMRRQMMQMAGSGGDGTAHADDTGGRRRKKKKGSKRRRRDAGEAGMPSRSDAADHDEEAAFDDDTFDDEAVGDDGSALAQQDADGPALAEQVPAEMEQSDDATGAMLDFGLELIERGQTDDAERFVRQAAEQGLDRAQYMLAVILRERGDSEAAQRWLEMAAMQGYAEAQDELAAEQYHRERSPQPHPPGTVTARRDGAGTMVIRWTPSQTANVTYRVSRRAADGSLRVVGRTPGTSIEDGGAPPAASAEYIVVALEAGRASAEASTAAAAAPSVAAVAAPSNVTARRTSAGHVLIAWNGPDGAEFKVSRVLPDGRQQIVGRTRNRSIEDGGAPAQLPRYVVVAVRNGVTSPSVST